MNTSPPEVCGQLRTGDAPRFDDGELRPSAWFSNRVQARYQRCVNRALSRVDG